MAATPTLCPGGSGEYWWVRRIFRRREKTVRRWNLVFLVLCGLALLVDPLFLYIPRIHRQHHCIAFHKNLLIVATLLRFTVDIFYLVRIHFQFRTAFVLPSESAVQVVADSSAIACRYLSSLAFAVDLFSLLPFPQVVVAVAWVFNKARGTGVLTAITVLESGVFLQLVPRVMRMYQLNQELVKTSFAINKGAIARTGITIFLYVAAAHVTGAFWYLLSIGREMDCWEAACGRASSPACDYNAVLSTCGNDNVRNDHSVASAIMDESCPRGSSSSSHFNYGMFGDAINSGILDSSRFHSKLLFCFWWALQSLSTFGQNIKPSGDSWEICFAICIFVVGLLLFSLVIAVIQTMMLTRSIRMEEIKMKWEDVDNWMSSHFIPRELRKRVRRHEEHRWRRHQGVDFNNLLRSLPKHLRRDINHHLCFNLITTVPMLAKLEERAQEELCDRVRPVLYTQGSCIFREGDPLDEMLFIVRGQVELSTTGENENEIIHGGDFYGEQLLTWASSPSHPSSSSSSSSSHVMRLPVSSKTCITLTEVEAFVLSAADLRSSIHNNAAASSSQFGFHVKDPIRWKSI